MTIKLENNFNNESFCPEVYNQLQIDMQGELRICCLTSDAGLLYDSDGKAMNVKTHSITDALNSNEHKQHRLELSNNIKPTRCSNCYNWEKHGSSRRNKFIQYSKNSKLPDYVKAEEAYSITSADGSIDTSTTKLLNLDIRFGNLCNLKCIMCDPGNSSLWYDDWELLSKTFNEYSASGKSVQFNNGGEFGGVSNFTFDSGTSTLTVPSIKSNTTANFQGATNVNLGNVANLHISGGQNGYVLQTDGTGNLSWTAGGGGGNGVPGGSNTQIQYNDAGTFGGSAYLTFNESTNTFQVAGNLIANSAQLGAGIYQFSTQYVYFATTSSTATDQLLWSVEVANVSGVDFHIISTDVAGSTRQSAKISTVVLGNSVVWNEFGSLQINGGTGSFSVVYEEGTIISPSIIKLLVTPDSANSTTYKMMITEYAP